MVLLSVGWPAISSVRVRQFPKPTRRPSRAFPSSSRTHPRATSPHKKGAGQPHRCHIANSITTSNQLHWVAAFRMRAASGAAGAAAGARKKARTPERKAHALARPRPELDPVEKPAAPALLATCSRVGHEGGDGERLRSARCQHPATILYSKQPTALRVGAPTPTPNPQ